MRLSQIDFQLMPEVCNFLNFPFHLFGHGIELLDLVLDLNALDLLDPFANIFAEQDIFFIFLVLVIFCL
jgi:hypothetical protein